MPTSTWPSRARCSAGSAPPGSGARRSAPRSCTRRCTTTSSIASRGRSRPPRSATRPATSLYGPMIDARFAERFEDWLELIQPHHRVHGSTGIGRITADNPRDGLRRRSRGGALLPPVDRRRRHARRRAVREPRRSARSSAWRASTTFDEAIELANGHGYGLSSSIYTTDPLTRVAVPRAGLGAAWSASTTPRRGAEAHLPFGGNGKSGNGSRQSGVWVLDQFTRWQAMNWDYSGRLQKAQMDVADVAADPGFRLDASG